MSDYLMARLGLKGEIETPLKPSYEFSHVATYGNDVPHSVVFMDELGDYLKVPVFHFEMGNYDEWQDRDILPTREVLRAAGQLALVR